MARRVFEGQTTKARKASTAPLASRLSFCYSPKRLVKKYRVRVRAPPPPLPSNGSIRGGQGRADEGGGGHYFCNSGLLAPFSERHLSHTSWGKNDGRSRGEAFLCWVEGGLGRVDMIHGAVYPVVLPARGSCCMAGRISMETRGADRPLYRGAWWEGGGGAPSRLVCRRAVTQWTTWPERGGRGVLLQRAVVCAAFTVLYVLGRGKEE